MMLLWASASREQMSCFNITERSELRRMMSVTDGPGRHPWDNAKRPNRRIDQSLDAKKGRNADCLPWNHFYEITARKKLAKLQEERKSNYIWKYTRIYIDWHPQIKIRNNLIFTGTSLYSCSIICQLTSSIPLVFLYSCTELLRLHITQTLVSVT